MGKASHPEILAEFGAVDNQGLQQYISRIGLELSGISHRPDLPWTFTLLDSPVVNAFAVPGGFIYVTRGILAYMNNEAELAGVLGHEIGHVTARHSVTQMSQQQLLGLGLGLGTVFSPTFGQFGGLAETGLGVLMMKYSRDHERQSDQLGIEYMSQVGYDPSQMSRFFEVFVGLREESGEPLPSWLSSHPAPPDRIRDTAAAAAKIKQENPGRTYSVNADALIKQIEGLVYGDNPREGFVDQGRFVHPDLRFQFDIPQGWQVQNTKSSVVLLEPKQSAVLQLTLAPSELGQTPEAAADTISRQEGVERTEGARIQINGNDAYLGSYRVRGQNGIAAVMAAFIAYGKNIYQMAGITDESRLTSFSRDFESSIRSFRTLTDSRILSVQPDRIKLYRARRGETLRSIAKVAQGSRITLEELALLNRLDPDQTLEPGTPVKTVQFGR